MCQATLQVKVKIVLLHSLLVFSGFSMASSYSTNHSWKCLYRLDIPGFSTRRICVNREEGDIIMLVPKVLYNGLTIWGLLLNFDWLASNMNV